MEVAVSALRAELARWIERVQAGDEVLVTERGVPVARLTPVEASPLLKRLTEQGVLSEPLSAKRPKAGATPRVRARGSVSDLVSEQRGPG
jgi:prevent-host-death family protein